MILTAAHAEAPQSGRMRILLERFRDDLLTVAEAHELRARLDDAMGRAEAADDRRAVLRLRLYHGGVESYLFLHDPHWPKP